MSDCKDSLESSMKTAPGPKSSLPKHSGSQNLSTKCPRTTRRMPRQRAVARCTCVLWSARWGLKNYIVTFPPLSGFFSHRGLDGAHSFPSHTQNAGAAQKLGDTSIFVVSRPCSIAHLFTAQKFRVFLSPSLSIPLPNSPVGKERERHQN